MPPKIKSHECKHGLQIKRSISFDAEDQKEAEKLGYTMPNVATVAFCIQCWAVNPTVAMRSIMPKEGKRLK